MCRGNSAKPIRFYFSSYTSQLGETVDKRMTLGYLPGGKNNYLGSIVKILEFIQSRNPAIEELRAWYARNFPSTNSLTAYKSGISTIENIELITITKNAVSLTDLGIRFLQTKNNQLIFESLRRNYAGMDEIIRLLRKRPRTLSEISSSLNRELDLDWKTDIQWQIRLNWLESLRLVTQTEGTYQLASGKQRPIHEGHEKPKEGLSLHNKVRDRIASIAKNEFIVKPEYPLGRKRLDVVWKQGVDDDPLTVCEVHFGGNLDGALTKLRMARKKWNSSLILVTNDEGISKVKTEIAKGFPELEGVVEVINYKETCDFFQDALIAERHKKTIERLTRRRIGIIVRDSERKKRRPSDDYRTQ